MELWELHDFLNEKRYRSARFWLLALQLDVAG